MNELYDRDILIWSEQQAALLRRLAAGERVNDRVDWENVIEEVESVGRSELNAVRSLLLNALAHDLKVEAWPEARDVPHWRAEARRFRILAADNFVPSMTARIDLADLYAKALRTLPETIDGRPPLPLSTLCPFASVEAALAET